MNCIVFLRWTMTASRGTRSTRRPESSTRTESSPCIARSRSSSSSSYIHMGFVVFLGGQLKFLFFFFFFFIYIH